MEYSIGAGLALAVGLFATIVRLDRDRGFYPTVLVVIATYYDLFAVMAGSVPVLGAEAVVSAAFIGLAVAGFRSSLWLVVAALVGHGMFDVFHARLIDNPGAPTWWPPFCLAYDVVAAGYLASRLRSTGTKASEIPGTSPWRRLPASGLRPHVHAELLVAANFESVGDPATAFRHLERAHVLAQSSTIEHVRVHVRMLRWSLRHRNAGEALGQLLRIVGAAIMTPIGLVPLGNTGGSKISPFRPRPISPSLAAIIEGATRRRAAGAARDPVPHHPQVGRQRHAGP